MRSRLHEREKRIELFIGIMGTCNGLRELAPVGYVFEYRVPPVKTRRLHPACLIKIDVSRPRLLLQHFLGPVLHLNVEQRAAAIERYLHKPHGRLEQTEIPRAETVECLCEPPPVLRNDEADLAHAMEKAVFRELHPPGLLVVFPVVETVAPDAQFHLIFLAVRHESSRQPELGIIRNENICLRKFFLKPGKILRRHIDPIHRKILRRSGPPVEKIQGPVCEPEADKYRRDLIQEQREPEQEHELHCCGGEENDDDELDSAHGP